jgi:hypothetical protein
MTLNHRHLGLPSCLFTSLTPDILTEFINSALLRPSHTSLFNALKPVQIMQPLITRFSPASCHFLHLIPKYSPQPPLRHSVSLRPAPKTSNNKQAKLLLLINQAARTAQSVQWLSYSPTKILPAQSRGCFLVHGLETEGGGPLCPRLSVFRS